MDPDAPEFLKKENAGKKSVLPKGELPHKAVSEQFATSQFFKQTKVYPEWDLPSVTPAYNLMVVKKELQKTEKILEEKRKENKQYRDLLDSEWATLRQKQKEVMESFPNHQTFIIENEKKRERAEHVIKVEKEKQEKFDSSINELKEKIKESLKIRDVMQSYVDQYKIYEDYLKSVVESLPEFNSIREVIDRYRTLISVERELEERKGAEVAAMEGYRKSMVELTVSKSQEMMVLNNKLIELQSSHERASNQLNWFQDMLSVIDANASRLFVEHSIVKAAILNLFKELCKFKRLHHISVKENDYEAQLKFIKTSYQELLKIANIAKAQEVSDEQSIMANLSFDSN
ncbi:unnamed protein product [Bemisia tabaci]|uniref:DUF4200 domain-containing protein n=1 Tax=Bemisia tabaci TaxID=7038 RepID=A0A9P0C4G1_BEMTA|nr:unnamed protein product [Bemisia tabaci]